MTEQVQAARTDLGLPLFNTTGGAAHDFIQKLRKQGLLSAKNTPPAPTEMIWKTEWRLLYLPSHRIVRQLSWSPVIDTVPITSNEQTHHAFLITVRDPAIPTFRVTVGKDMPNANLFRHRRGLYFLRLEDSLYIGKSDEFHVRFSGHQQKKPLWWVFIALEAHDTMFTLDAISAAESLLISFWNETTVIKNGNRGSDQRPAFLFLQQAVLFSMAASAAFLWLLRTQVFDYTEWTIPFKSWRGAGWPQCYIDEQ